MNLRPLRPEHSALPNCATFRFFIFFVFYRPSRSLVSIGIWLPFHSPSALHSDFLYFLYFIDPHAVWFQLEFGFRSTRQVRYIPIFYIFCILSTLTQFGFNWNWLPFHSPSALFRIYTSCWFSPTICTTILYQKN